MQIKSLHESRSTQEIGEEQVSNRDEAAMVRAAVDDPDAFAELYWRYLPRVYRYVYSRVGEKHAAEDLSALIFGAVWEGLPNYRERGSFTSWIFRITRNKVNDYFRRKRTDIPLEQVSAAAAGESDPHAWLEKNETLGKLAGMLKGLDEQQRELLRLRFAAELTYVEMAKVLNRSEGAVKMALRRLLDSLKEAWEVSDE
ncbi:MAG: RNA polymerase sigma factor [Anaerolineales bacterium]